MNKRFLSILSRDEISDEAWRSVQKRAKAKMQSRRCRCSEVGIGNAPSCEEKRLPGSQVYDKEANEQRWVTGSLVQRYQD